MSAVQRALLAIVVLAAMVGLAVGVSAFAFVCDDAYIAFRYCSNLLAGHGLVWNPAPFRPVEGYTSLLWVLLMSGAWWATGLAPPDVANSVLYAFSCGSLLVVTHMVLRLPLTERLRPWRVALVALVLLGVVSNRTFLIWTSSGLEQAMFTFWVLCWLAVAVFHRTSRTGLIGLGLLAAAIELTRPDGLLYAAATAVIMGLWLHRQWRQGALRATDGLVGIGLLGPVLHVAWRLWTYGEWLPNTYYAKSVEPWPIMGLLYLASFLLEYAWFLLLPLGLVAWRRGRGRPRQARGPILSDRLVRWTAWATVSAQAAFYVFNVGGDHFGFRIFHHAVPLLWLAVIALLDRLRGSPALALTAGVGIVVFSWIIPWTHHAQTRDIARVRALGWDPHDVAPHLPIGLDAWGWVWDRSQHGLRSRFVCVRHRAHVTRIEGLKRTFGTREQNLALDLRSEIPVLVATSVGYPGWALPQVNVLDVLGLNDAIIARNPAVKRKRKMAHDRRPPEGYLRCFRPNVWQRGGEIHAKARRPPLTAEEVVDCEERFMAIARAAARGEAPGAP